MASDQEAREVRRYAITGAASGIGKVTKETLEAQGHRVVGIDLRGSDIDADLATEEGRARLPELVAAALGNEPLDAVIACAGVSFANAVTVRVNYFGAAATLDRLRPLMEGSSAPRTAIVASFSALQEVDERLMEALRRNDEEAAARRAEELVEGASGHLIYASTKLAIAEWARAAAVAPEWAGAGIAVNAVAPGIIVTPMTEELLSTPEGRQALLEVVPMPLNGPAQPDVVAEALIWLTAAANTHITGQVLFVDGGADASIRGPRVLQG